MFKYFRYDPTTGEYVTTVTTKNKNTSRHDDVNLKDWLRSNQVLPNNQHFFDDGRIIVIEYSDPEYVKLLTQRTQESAKSVLDTSGYINSVLKKAINDAEM